MFSEDKKTQSTPEKKEYTLLIGILAGCLLATIIALAAILLHKRKAAGTPEPQVQVVNVDDASQEQERKQAQLQMQMQEQEDIISLVNRWCECHTSGDVPGLSNLYGAQVRYYQSDYSLEKVLNSKRSLFSKADSFYQTASDFRFEERADGNRRVYFTKNTSDGIYPSYLGVRKTGGAWKIVEESDLVTDRNLARKKLARMELLAEDTQYGYYAKFIRQPADEFESATKELYRYDKQTYDLDCLFTGGGEKPTSLLPMKNGGERISVCGIDSVHILAPTRIVVTGWAAPNTLSYLIDTESRRCADLGGEYSTMKLENGKNVIVVISTRFGELGRENYERIFDLDGNYLHDGESYGSIYDD